MKKSLSHTQTPIGLLPSDWRLRKLGEVIERVGRPVHVEASRSYVQIGIRSHGKGIFHKDPVQGIELGAKSVFWIEPDRLVLNIVFAWERAVARTTDKEIGTIGSHRFPMYRPKTDAAKTPLVDIDYVLAYLLTKRGEELLQESSPGGAGRNKTLGQELFLSHIIPVPPLSEQRRIVAVLSSCDRLIELKQKLLEEKQIQKQALLQQFFDPNFRIRLPKFSGPWVLKTLQEIGEFEKGHGITNDQCLSGDCPCIKYGDIYVYYDTYFSKSQSRTTESVFGQSLRVEAGSLLFTCSGEDPLEIGKCVVYTGKEPIAVGGDILVFHSHKHEPLFLAYQQQTSALIRQKAALAKGQSIFHIHLAEIQGLQVSVPPTIKEERAIANTLLAADREIDGLAREVEEWKEKKKALSQLLLSGKVRV